MKSLQEGDRDICLIRGWLERGEKPGPADIARESYVVKTLVGQWERLEIHNELVHDKLAGDSATVTEKTCA